MTNLISSQSIPLSLAGADEASCAPKICDQAIPDNFTIFTASANDQTSGSIEEAKHGMFSYYLMKGMEGAADENKDNKISNGELISYIQNNVSKVAFSQNREQDPGMLGDKDKILFNYN